MAAQHVASGCGASSEEAVDHNPAKIPGLQLLFYRAAPPLSCAPDPHLCRRDHPRSPEAIGSCWRELSPGGQALLVLVYVRKGDLFVELAAGSGVSAATARRYVNDRIALLAARTPKLRRALRDAGRAYVVLDSTSSSHDRVAAERPFCSAKHRKHRMICRSSPSPDRNFAWV